MIVYALSNDAHNLAESILEYAKQQNQRTVTPHLNYIKRSQVFELEDLLTNKCLTNIQYKRYPLKPDRSSDQTSGYHLRRARMQPLELPLACDRSLLGLRIQWSQISAFCFSLWRR